MKVFALLAAVGASALTLTATAQTPPTPAPPPAKIDTDGNGAISRAEFLADAGARFARMDANNDGQVTQDERRAARGAMREARGPGRRGGGAMAPGYVAPRGPEGGPLAGMEQMGRGGRGGGGGGRALQMADTDRDGRISRAEYDTLTARGFARAQARGIDRATYDQRAAARFTRMDTNRDGAIDTAERDAAMAAMASRRGDRGMAPPPPAPPAPPTGG